MFQALGETIQKAEANVRLDQGGRTPRQEHASPYAASQPRVAPGAAPQPSAAFVPPPRTEVPPQPSTSGWVPSGPHPPLSRGSRSSYESETSETESEYAARESSSFLSR